MNWTNKHGALPMIYFDLCENMQNRLISTNIANDRFFDTFSICIDFSRGNQRISKKIVDN